MTMKFHPLADAFPLIEGAQFQDLAASIKSNGLRHPIVLLDGMILDGRNRYRACQTLGIDPATEVFTGTDPMAFVLDENLHRRHLNESQRGMVAARLATLSVGRPEKNIGIPTITRNQAAALLNIGIDTVTDAKKILAEGTPDQIKLIEQGEAAVSTTANYIRQSKKSGKPSLAQAGKNPDRFERRRERALLWGQLRDALNNLTSLPLPTDVLAICGENDRLNLIPQKLPIALQWLKEFEHAWRNRDQNAA